MYPYIVNDPFWDPISGIPHETMGHLRESLASKDPAPEKMSLSLSRACPKVLLRMVFSQSPNIYWLVVLTILKNMKVSWGYYSQYMENLFGFVIPSGYVNSLLLKMAIEIVDLPIENGDVPIAILNYPRVISVPSYSAPIGPYDPKYVLIKTLLNPWFLRCFVALAEAKWKID